MNTGTGRINLNQLILVLRWPILAVIGIWYLYVELVEHPGALMRWDSTFVIEIIIIEGLIILMGMIIGWLVNTIRENNSTLRILEAKNDLSQQLTTASDWEQMTTLLVEYPRTILPLKVSSLFVYSPKSDQYELTAYWSSDSNDLDYSTRMPAPHRCSKCAYTQPFKLRPVEILCNSREGDLNSENDYCLPLSYGDAMRAILQLRLLPDTKPTPDQVEIINNLGPEMAISLRAAQENHVREQLVAEKSAEAARQGIVRDMHDTIAQNLAYMQLKFDHLLQLNKQEQAEEFDKDLHKLRDVADESYEMVRNTLGALHPANSSRLGETLSQHAYTFAERTDFDIKFSQEGQSRPLDPLVIHHVYQLYREALNNVFKHAEAKLVETSLVWLDGCFQLTIIDDGRGFDTLSVDENGHHGVEFMGERVDELDGEFSIDSEPGKGTIITISVPFVPIDKFGIVSTSP